MKPVPRPRRVYWIRRTNDKDLLVFDGGYWGGDIRVYERKESIPTKQIEDDVKSMLGRQGLPDEMLTEIVNLWLEKKYGLPFYWDVKG